MKIKSEFFILKLEQPSKMLLMVVSPYLLPPHYILGIL